VKAGEYGFTFDEFTPVVFEEFKVIYRAE